MKNRILVVDDNVDLTTLLLKALGKHGYEVFVENDSTFALDTTRRVRPNLVLLDVMMPDRDGGQVLIDLRNDVQLRPIPVILLTALAREAHSLANQGGIQSLVLSKPVEINVLLAEITKHLDASKTFRERMAERVAAETGLPVQLRAGNAFGGPDPSHFRKQGAGQAIREIESGFTPFSGTEPKKVGGAFGG